MMRPILALIAAVTLAACGKIENSDPQPRLETASTPGTAYGNTLVGTRKRLDFVLRNSDAGFAQVNPLTDIVPTVTGAGLTLARNTCTGTLNEGENCFLTVDYEPADADTGALDGRLSVTSNAKEGPVTLALSGTAFKLLPTATGAVSFDAGADGDFGDVPVNQSKSMSFSVRNIGSAADTLTISGPTQTGWSFLHDCPSNPVKLTNGAACQITVKFTPDSFGVSEPSPLVISDPYNADYGGLSLSLRGTGV